MIQRPFWVEDYPRPSGLGTDQLPNETDYLIVGGGLTGTAAALRLARAAKTVVVVDAGEIAGGASSINGGMVSPDVKAGIRAVEQSHGPEIASEVWAASVRSVDIVVDLCRQNEIDASINRDGMSALALGPRDLDKFEATVRWYHERFGVDWEVLGPDRVGEIANSDSFTGALFEPEGFGIHPARYSFQLAAAVVGRGGLMVANTPVTSIEKNRNGFEVRTGAGVTRAGNVMVATNGYTTNEPLPQLRRRVVPVGSYIIVTEPLGSVAAQVFPANSMTYTKRRLLHYMRRTPDDRVLIGGRRNLKTELPLDDSARDLRASLVGYFPQLESKSIDYVWGGKLGVPFDLTPHVGRIDGVWYAMGYAGHGVGLSTLLGHELAGMFLGEDPTSVFARIPHDGRFYYRGQPWFLNPASVLYRTLDKLGV